MLRLTIEEPELTNILRHLQTTHLPINDADVIGGYRLEAESARFISFSKVILHRFLSVTQGESHALAQSLIHTSCGSEAWPRLDIQFCGGSLARQYTNLRLTVTHTVTYWGKLQQRRHDAQALHSVASLGKSQQCRRDARLKHYTQWLQTTQECETTHKTRINNESTTSRLHQLSVQSEDNLEIIYYSTWI
eukprot:3574958-Amphidinium_carterae.2